MLWILWLLACAHDPATEPAPGPGEVLVDGRPCEDGSRVSVDTLEGARTCAACPCDVSLRLPSIALRASGTFVVTGREVTRTIRCSWTSQWATMAEAAAAELGAAPVDGSVGQDAARLIWDEAGLRVQVPDGRDARCGP